MMDIDTVFEDHNYVYRRHGSLCACNGDSSSESDSDDEDCETEGINNAAITPSLDATPSVLYFPGLDSCNKDYLGQTKKLRHGPHCACDSDDSGRSSDSSSSTDTEDEEETDSEKESSEKYPNLQELHRLKSCLPEDSYTLSLTPKKDSGLFSQLHSQGWRKILHCSRCLTPIQPSQYCNSCLQEGTDKSYTSNSSSTPISYN